MVTSKGHLGLHFLQFFAKEYQTKMTQPSTMATSLPPTQQRISEHSYGRHNKMVTERTIDSLKDKAFAPMSAVTSRFGQLDHEFDLERTLMMNASLAAGTGECPALARSTSLLSLALNPRYNTAFFFVFFNTFLINSYTSGS
jgi:hypothetical protein